MNIQKMDRLWPAMDGGQFYQDIDTGKSTPGKIEKLYDTANIIPEGTLMICVRFCV